MLKSRETDMAVALTIAGSDSGAGAGIQVDLLTFAAQGVYGTTAITCLTAQNPHGVTGIHVAPAPFVIEQCQQVINHYRPHAIKTGMLFNSEIVLAVADFLSQGSIPTVVDPVMVASSGATLLSPEAIAAIKNYLIPRATLVTPNLDEASILLGRKIFGGEKSSEESIALAQQYGVPFLLKGGHASTDVLIDTLAWPDGKTLRLQAPRIPNIDTHGSGCTLSAAITAQLALGQDLATATTKAHRYLQEGMKNPIQVAGLKHIRH